LQILYFILQLITSSQQTRAIGHAEAENRRLNFQTATLLEKIQSSAEASERVLVRQFENLLDFVTSGRAAGEKDKDDADLGGRFELPVEPSAVERWPWRTPSGPSPEDQRVIDEMRAWVPTEGAKDRMEVLRQLPPPAIAMLERYRKDEIRSRENGRSVGLRRSEETASRATYRLLEEAGLTEMTDVYPVSRLTERGRQVAALLSAAYAPSDLSRQVYDWVTDGDEEESQPS
jgi:hypothetical protein